MKTQNTLSLCNIFDFATPRAGRIASFTLFGLATCFFAMFATLRANAADLFTNFNSLGVSSGVAVPTEFTLTDPAEITEVVTYHYNNGQGQAPGFIALIALKAPVLFPNPLPLFPARGEPSGAVQNANWVATVNLRLPAGTYGILDSSPATHSQNAKSKGIGFAIVRGNYLPSTDLANNFNTNAVFNGPPGPTEFTLPSPAEIKELTAYFWNNGNGEPPGTITLKSVAAPVQVNRQFQAFGHAGPFGVPNALWVAPLDLTLPAGTYAIDVSNRAAWSQNSQSSGHGFIIVRGTLVSPLAVIVPPPPLPPPPPPTPTPTPSAFPPPCNRTTGAKVELAQPGCVGPVGTPLTFVVLSPLTAPESMAGIQFKPPSSPSACRVQFSSPPATAQVTVFPGAAGTNGLVLTSGTGLSAGSTFTTTAPPGLCLAGSGTWTWQIHRLSPGPLGLGRTGVIDCFTVQCP